MRSFPYTKGNTKEIKAFMVSVSYNKLWKMLNTRNLSRTELKEKSGISFNVLARMGKNESVSLESLEKICVYLKCNIGEVMDFPSCVQCQEQLSFLNDKCNRERD